MAAGSGPYCSAPLTAGSITTTSNAFTATSPVCNFNNSLGVLVTVTLYWTPSATQTITVKLYQGNGVAGPQVGPAGGLVATGTGTTEQEGSFAFIDTSPYGLQTQQAQYTAGFTASSGTGTVNYLFIEVETMATIF